MEGEVVKTLEGSVRREVSKGGVIGTEERDK